MSALQALVLMALVSDTLAWFTEYRVQSIQESSAVSHGKDEGRLDLEDIPMYTIHAGHNVVLMKHSTETSHNKQQKVGKDHIPLQNYSSPSILGFKEWSCLDRVRDYIRDTVLNTQTHSQLEFLRIHGLL